MNDVFDEDLDAAITHLENKVKGLELSLELGRSRRETATRREIRTYSIAITAMREMRERKGCQHRCTVDYVCLACGMRLKEADHE